ncbi:hypothetical protein AMTRI_Chr07g79380 [Amborella trichopoda]
MPNRQTAEYTKKHTTYSQPYSPSVNLASNGQLDDNNHSLTFDAHDCQIEDLAAYQLTGRRSKTGAANIIGHCITPSISVASFPFISIFPHHPWWLHQFPHYRSFLLQTHFQHLLWIFRLIKIKFQVEWHPENLTIDIFAMTIIFKKRPIDPMA